MCYTTKERIAAALRELMREKSLKKITVMDVMDRTHMKRQSFYYHFHDIYDVLEWMIDRQLFEPLKFDPEISYIDWWMAVIAELDRDRWFYRKALNAIGTQLSLGKAQKAVRPQICRLVAGDPFPEEKSLSEEEVFMIDFFSRAVCIELMHHVTSREDPDPERTYRRINTIVKIIGQDYHFPKT